MFHITESTNSQSSYNTAPETVDKQFTLKHHESSASDFRSSDYSLIPRGFGSGSVGFRDLEQRHMTARLSNRQRDPSNSHTVSKFEESLHLRLSSGGRIKSLKDSFQSLGRSARSSLRTVSQHWNQADKPTNLMQQGNKRIISLDNTILSRGDIKSVQNALRSVSLPVRFSKEKMIAG